jgi:2-dehydro-3-deoxy-D-gluconate 5-dehydrogenase
MPAARTADDGRGMPALFDLGGRVALVTGANTGLGQAIAIALAGAGADVALVGRSPMDETASRIAASGGRTLAIAADLGEHAAIDGIVARALAWRGGIDILVNNAGIIRRADALEFTVEDWDAVIDVNQKAAFFLSQAVARTMVARNAGGKIINIASLLSFQGGLRVAAYTAAKSALAGLTRLCACEWAPLGINVNAIAPGYFETANTQALRADPARRAAISARIPAGRWGVPADLAGAAVFLASSASDYVHGVVLPVDGGWLAR